METEKLELQLAEDNQFGKKGQRVTLALQPADVHDPTELPTYLAGYSPLGFRADEASPIILVDNDSDKFRNFNSDDAFRRVDVKGSVSGAVPEVDPKSALDTYKVVSRAVGSFIPWATENQSGNNYQPTMAATRRCRRAIDLDREFDVFGATPEGLLQTVANWDASVVKALTTAWDIGGDALKDLQEAIERSAQQVTRIWMNQRLGHIFLRNDSVRDHMRQMMGDGAAQAALQQVSRAAETNVDFQLIGLPPVSIAASKARTEPGTDIDYVFPNGNVVLVTAPPGVPEDGEEIATTYTFRRRGPSGTGFQVREFFVPGRGELGGTMVVVSMADQAKMTGSNVGGLLTGAAS